MYVCVTGVHVHSRTRLKTGTKKLRFVGGQTGPTVGREKGEEV